MSNSSCPCGSGHSYLDCCGPFISHEKFPATPEQLMRSRYTAYTQVNMDYLQETMKSPASDHFELQSSQTWAEKSKWLGLIIINTSQDENRGTVEFIATYTVDNQKYTLHEISEFKQEDGKWYYVDGVHPVQTSHSNIAEKIGRNDPCPCGSGKKFKKCCGA